MDRMPCCREYLSEDHPIKRDDLLKAFQGQSHRSSRRHSIQFSAKEMSRWLKCFLRKDVCLYMLGTPGRGGIFVEILIVNRITHSVGEIFFPFLIPFRGHSEERRISEPCKIHLKTHYIGARFFNLQ